MPSAKAGPASGRRTVSSKSAGPGEGFVKRLGRKISERWNRAANQKKAAEQQEKKKQRQEKEAELAHLLINAVAASSEDIWLSYILRADDMTMQRLTDYIDDHPAVVGVKEFRDATPEARSAAILHIISRCAYDNLILIEDDGILKAETRGKWLDLAIGKYYKLLQKMYKKIPAAEKQVAGMAFVQSIVGTLAPAFARHFSTHFTVPGHSKSMNYEGQRHQLGQAVDKLFDGVVAVLGIDLQRNSVAHSEDPHAIGKVGRFWSSV